LSTGSADWQQVVSRLRDGTSAGAWNLPRSQVADDLAAVLAAPDSMNQGAFGFCGIAAFLRFWARRDPGALAAFAEALYEHGAASFGGYDVVTNEHLRSLDYATAYAAGGMRCPPGQWMIMGAIQNSISPAGFDGTVDRSWLAFLSLHEGAQPHQIASLLKHTGLYQDVDVRIDWASIVAPRIPWLPDPWRPGMSDVLALRPVSDTDIVLEINDAFLHGANPIPPGLLGEVQDDYPNHFVVLTNRFRHHGDHLRGRVWTWASHQDIDVPEQTLLTNYYGAIVCTAHA
jgi:hypothetical protein